MSIIRQRFSKNFFRYNSLGPGFNPTADFAITGPASVDEGAEADFNVRAFGLQTGSTLQWSVIDNSSNLNGRFDNTGGDLSLLNNYNGAFAVTVDADQTTANDPQSYTVGILWNDQLAATKTITVNDTSQDPPTPVGHDFFFAGDQDFWLAFGGVFTNSTFSNPPPANPAYTYPDNSYTGKTRNFTGSEWMASPNLGVGGAWANNPITIDFWFYPTANDVQIISECNPADVVTSYHYSVLEINSSGNVKARFYNGTPITSTNTVELNKWNHVWFTEDSQGGHSFELNGVATTGNPTYTRIKPTSEYFVIGLNDGTNMGSTGRFQGKIGYLSLGDYVATSTYANTVAKFRPAPSITWPDPGGLNSGINSKVWTTEAWDQTFAWFDSHSPVINGVQGSTVGFTVGGALNHTVRFDGYFHATQTATYTFTWAHNNLGWAWFGSAVATPSVGNATITADGGQHTVALVQGDFYPMLVIATTASPSDLIVTMRVQGGNYPTSTGSWSDNNGWH